MPFDPRRLRQIGRTLRSSSFSFSSFDSPEIRVEIEIVRHLQRLVALIGLRSRPLCRSR